MPVHDAAGLLDEALRQLVGEEASTVAFVRDYVELHFDGPVLTVYSPITVEVDGLSVAPGDRGWRDALCRTIGLVVTATSSEADARVVFGDGLELVIDLADMTAGAEAMQLIPSMPDGTPDRVRATYWVTGTQPGWCSGPPG